MLTGSMTGAAEMMSVTQPAVSRLVRDFEVATGLMLFERHGNHIAPTQEAINLMKEVARSFLGLDHIATVAADIGRHSAGSLRIAAMPALANGVLARFLAGFVRDKPNLYVALTGLSSSLVIEAVAAGQADIGYADSPVDRLGLSIESRPCAAVVALPVGHRLAAKRLIEPADFAGERFITLEPGSLSAMRIDVALAGVSRLSLIEARLSHSALTLVAQGAGVCILDPAAYLDFIGKGVVIRPFSVFIDAGFSVFRQAERSRSSLVDLFKEQFWIFYEQELARLALI